MDEISVEKARPKLGDIVRDADRHGVTTRITLNGRAAAMVAPLARLTGADREIIRRASLLGDLGLIDGLREHTGEQDVTQAFIDGWAEAQDLLRAQAAIIARLDGHAAAQEYTVPGCTPPEPAYPPPEYFGCP